MRKSKAAEHRTVPTVPRIDFMDVVPSEEARPGDIVSFFNRNGNLCGNRLGVVVEQKRLKADQVAVRLKKPGGKLGPAQVINRKDLLRVYRETVMEDPTDEVL